MTRTIIAVGILILMTAAAAAAPADQKSSDVSRLAYNPTYDLWYFIPTGRPTNLGDNIKAAYKERRPGGVCYRPETNWYFCSSLEAIPNDFDTNNSCITF